MIKTITCDGDIYRNHCIACITVSWAAQYKLVLYFHFNLLCLYTSSLQKKQAIIEMSKANEKQKIINEIVKKKPRHIKTPNRSENENTYNLRLFPLNLICVYCVHKNSLHSMQRVFVCTNVVHTWKISRSRA